MKNRIWFLINSMFGCVWCFPDPSHQFLRLCRTLRVMGLCGIVRRSPVVRSVLMPGTTWSFLFLVVIQNLKLYKSCSGLVFKLSFSLNWNPKQNELKGGLPYHMLLPTKTPWLSGCFQDRKAIAGQFQLLPLKEDRWVWLCEEASLSFLPLLSLCQ